MISRDRFIDFAIYSINEAVYTLAKENNIELRDDGGFAFPYLQIARFLFKDDECVSVKWAKEFLLWAIRTVCTLFAERQLRRHCVCLLPDQFIERFADEFDAYIKYRQELESKASN